MKTKIKYTDIINRNPCYDPIEIGMPKNYEDSIVEFIKEYRSKVKDEQDIFWVVINRDYMTKIESLEFSLFAANRVKHLMKDKRSLNALRVTELYLKGKATEEELVKAADVADAVNAVAEAVYAVYAARAAHATRAAKLHEKNAQIDKLIEIFEKRKTL